jgi:hypothetical protein
VKEDGVHVPGLRAAAANFVDGLLLAFSMVGVDGRVLLGDLEWRRERYEDRARVRKTRRVMAGRSCLA